MRATGGAKRSPSPQTLSLADRRHVAGWAAECAARVLPLFEVEYAGDDRPRLLVERARAFARGELDAAGEIRRRFVGGIGAGEGHSAVAAAAARAAGQAAAVCHMGAHGLGAAAYAARAVGLAEPHHPEAVVVELAWQLGHMSAAVREALRQLPRVGEDRSGPIGPRLLASGELGRLTRALQEQLGPAAPGVRARLRPG